MPNDRVPADFYSPEYYRTEESVGYLMRRAVMGLMQETSRRLEPVGLTNAQWAPMFKLHMGKASTVAELARELEMDPGATTRLLDRLEAKGLCRRVRSEVDRRVVNVELTDEGTRVAEQIPKALSEVMNAHLSGFSRDEWQAFKGYLVRMIDNADALKPSP